jgi:hypothetical protein
MSEDSKLLKEHQEHQEHLQIFSPMTRNNQECGLKLALQNLNLVPSSVNSIELQFLVGAKELYLVCIVVFSRATYTSRAVTESSESSFKIFNSAHLRKYLNEPSSSSSRA